MALYASAAAQGLEAPHPFMPHGQGQDHSIETRSQRRPFFTSSQERLLSTSLYHHIQQVSNLRAVVDKTTEAVTRRFRRAISNRMVRPDGATYRGPMPADNAFAWGRMLLYTPARNDPVQRPLGQLTGRDVEQALDVSLCTLWSIVDKLGMLNSMFQAETSRERLRPLIASDYVANASPSNLLAMARQRREVVQRLDRLTVAFYITVSTLEQAFEAWDTFARTGNAWCVDRDLDDFGYAAEGPASPCCLSSRRRHNGMFLTDNLIQDLERRFRTLPL
jgi:hypothetical protein